MPESLKVFCRFADDSFIADEVCTKLSMSGCVFIDTWSGIKEATDQEYGLQISNRVLTEC